MKITDIKFIEHLVPKGSCGTGYSEPDKFKITCNKNLYENDIWHKDSNEKEVWIDIWYRTNDVIKSIFIKEIQEHIGYVKNIDEAFEMYKKALQISTACPYCLKNK